ncbi:uncharacterized protein LOC115967191 [Quercus lobata]|uniref:uncharacterized protein LOC115967191 n=1 Tax=Quercus lobata TaxID=97700 RepID=UPI0012470E7C|nr:uncharacterized protein LOC115967191 [Quercus lobata]
MLAFKETLLHCGLEDLGYHGHPFTWRSGRPSEAFVEVRLDQACASSEWRSVFPLAKVAHLQGQTRHKRLHRFEERWVAHEGCEEVIRDAWSYHPPNGSLMFKLFEKIKCCRMKLVAWS